MASEITMPPLVDFPSPTMQDDLGIEKEPSSQSLSAQERFESLAKRLFTVPKRELGEKLAE